MYLPTHGSWPELPGFFSFTPPPSSLPTSIITPTNPENTHACWISHPHAGGAVPLGPHHHPSSPPPLLYLARAYTVPYTVR